MPKNEITNSEVEMLNILDLCDIFFERSDRLEYEIKYILIDRIVISEIADCIEQIPLSLREKFIKQDLFGAFSNWITKKFPYYHLETIWNEILEKIRIELSSRLETTQKSKQRSRSQIIMDGKELERDIEKLNMIGHGNDLIRLLGLEPDVYCLETTGTAKQLAKKINRGRIPITADQVRDAIKKTYQLCAADDKLRQADFKNRAGDTATKI